MLETKTKEQRIHIEEIVRKYINPIQNGCRFVSADVYVNYGELVEINLRCEDCDNNVSVDLRFDMMAEIVDYLREQNNK